MNVVQVNHRFDASLLDPEALLARYTTLTGLGTALLEAGAASVHVVQRFHCDAAIVRDQVQYHFVRGSVGAALAKLRPQIVHVNGLDSPAETWRLGLRLPQNACLVVQDHKSQVPPDSWLRRKARIHAFRRASAFFFTCAELAEPWRKAGVIGPRQRVFEVLESGTVMRPIDRVEARRSAGLRGSPSLLWVGRLNETKDPLTVLEGFEAALALLPAASLTMVYSDDDLLPEVKRRLASSPALAASVRLVGRLPHDRLAAFYSAADIFVLGSRFEGSGYALMEACACGAVPVVTRIPPFRAITGDGAIGALWTPGDPSAFAAALVATAATDLDAARRRTIEHSRRTTSWEVVGRQALDAYRLVSRGA